MSEDTKASIFGVLVQLLFVFACAWFIQQGHGLVISILAGTGAVAAGGFLWFLLYMAWVSHDA